MKIKAYQVAPEYQESPLYLFDEWGEMEIYGNDDYKRHTSAVFDEVLNALNNGTFDDVDTEGKDVDRLEALADKYYTSRANNQEIIAEALSIMTGEKWKYMCISGCCQSDWNYIYYRPDMWNEKALQYFETEYFNTGDEWVLEDEEGDSWGSVYTHEYNNDERKKEIAENIGVETNDISLYLFDGWTKTAKYKEA